MRHEMLKQIYGELLDMMAWQRKPFLVGHIEEVSCSAHKAEALIEFIETEDCGSVGGFDKGQEPPRNLLTRFEWICNKFHKGEFKISEV